MAAKRPRLRPRDRLPVPGTVLTALTQEKLHRPAHSETLARGPRWSLDALATVGHAL